MVDMNPRRGILGNSPTGAAGGGFNNLAAGNKSYGQGRPMPNIGATANKVGYGKRDGEMAARRDALLNRAKGYL
jgi:hypothetical protein